MQVDGSLSVNLRDAGTQGDQQAAEIFVQSFLVSTKP